MRKRKYVSLQTYDHYYCHHDEWMHINNNNMNEDDNCNEKEEIAKIHPKPMPSSSFPIPRYQMLIIRHYYHQNNRNNI